MFNMSAKKQITSKGMFAGWILVGVGLYVIVERGDVTGGMSVAAFGLGILGIRDAQDKE